MRVATFAARHLPTMRATIERRIFLTYRVDPAAMRALVPERYELRLTDGMAIGGVCLITLRHLRPSHSPKRLGLRSNSAAHRISILGPDTAPAIWAPRRDTDSRVSTAVGAAMFPNTPGRARFEQGTSDIAMNCSDRDGATIASITARAAPSLPADSVFDSPRHVNDYYRAARHGYSPSTTEHDSTIDLQIDRWDLEPLHVLAAHSAVFSPLVETDDAEFDHAVCMRDVNSVWRFGTV